ncbi:proton-conducting transporter membrane subunit [Eubacterium oxidoreducens]|uniref:Multicomponent Na+:H+ antiporter subunit D n=1 Tax=Eubacterium oxidoreducens TaxID=1732 RepID=A0A1G6BSL3_EUBOX|nr:proton-conducting transporter membrane subunit [Eubacterium oxidoreducens]SDB23566.1 multicomponent Na+:H+ antiporter subunit D [Eubacterium oxidoreducens]
MITLPFEFIYDVHPGIFLIVAGILLAIFPVKIRRVCHVAIAIFAWYLTMTNPIGTKGYLNVFGDYTLFYMKVTEYNLIFLIAFASVGVIGAIFSFGHTSRLEGFASTAYVGCALGITLAGDWLTLFIFWEIMAIVSLFLVWDSHTMVATRAGFRYLLMHMVGGSLMLFGVVDQMVEGEFYFVQMTGGDMNLSFWLIFLGMIINAGVVPLHFWIPDAYPESTLTGGVYMNALTTKAAVFALLTSFIGFKVLIMLGVIMIIYGAMYALITSDFRKILSYHIISQVGFMVTDIGIGGAVGANASEGLAFTHIMYKMTLFMCAGVVIFATGKRNITDLGGLYKKMPLVTVCYFIAALSISGVPPFAGFVGKSWSILAAEENGLTWVMILMTLGSVMTALSILFKTGYYVFFTTPRSDYQIKKVPGTMKAAMLIGTGLCVFIGVTPQLFYRLLPHSIEYHPYTISHVFEYVLLMAATMLIFMLFRKKLAPHHAINLDIDYLLRGPGQRALLKGSRLVIKVCSFLGGGGKRMYDHIQKTSHQPYKWRRPMNVPEEKKGSLRYEEDAFRMKIGEGMFSVMAAIIVIGIILLVLAKVR